MEEKIVKVAEGGERIDVYLREKIGVSRALIQEWIKEGQVRIEGKQLSPHYRLKAGETIRTSIPPPPPPLQPEPIPLRIIYQDSQVAVIDKPAGLITHPAGRRRKGTLVNALLHYFPDSLSCIG
ncbi:MAG: RNA pseudouridine synthase, partial [Caldiserica bacterium]|nr:RNA pseudouridine synthase [Caldisericota bacterium]